MNKIFIGFGNNIALSNKINLYPEKNITEFTSVKLCKIIDSLKLKTGIHEIDKLLNPIIYQLQACIETYSYNKFIQLIYYIHNHKKFLDNKILAIDNIEQGLHPENQLIFVEILCIISKIFKTEIYGTTNSPYVLNSFEVFSSKYEIEDSFKYYLTDVFGYTEDHTDDLEEIYLSLAAPLQQLENEENQLYYYDGDE